MRIWAIAAAAALLGACVHEPHDIATHGRDGGAPGARHHNGDAPQALQGAWIQVTRALDPPTITFETRRASGFAGCNRWFAEVTHDRARLRFSGVGATRMACDPPAMQIESAFLAMIERTRAHRRDGDTLTLLDEAGAEIAAFARAP